MHENIDFKVRAVWRLKNIDVWKTSAEKLDQTDHSNFAAQENYIIGFLTDLTNKKILFQLEILEL